MGKSCAKKVVDMCDIDQTAGVERLSRSERVRARLHFGDEKGGALVEFALVLPVLLLVVTAITTFGIALNNYLQLTEAVGIGGQVLSVSRGNTTDPCNIVSSAVTRQPRTSCRRRSRLLPRSIPLLRVPRRILARPAAAAAPPPGQLGI